MNPTTFAHTYTLPGLCLKFTKWKIGGTKSVSCGFYDANLGGGGKLVDGSFVVAVGLLLDYSSCSCFTAVKNSRGRRKGSRVLEVL